MNWKSVLLAVVVVTAGTATGWGLYGWWRTPASPRELTQQLDATVFPADYARLPEVQLQTADGAFTRDDLAGRWTLLFMGYTHCPDICPTTLQRLALALDAMRGENAPTPRVLFVSVDYPRDTPQGVSKYAAAFGNDFTGATADEATLRRIADTLHVSFSIPDDRDDGNYAVQHSGAVFLLDPAGRVRALLGSPKDPATIAEEVTRIRKALEAHG